jgi:hypothetical protein
VREIGRLAAGAATVLLLVAGCGGDDDGDGKRAAEEKGCVERWNEGAHQDLRAKLSLAGAADEALVGRYSGEEFTTEAEDAAGGNSSDRTVRPGDCVVGRRGSLPDEWLVFFLERTDAGGAAWYDISHNVSDDRHPLKVPSERVLDDPVRPRVVGLGVESKLQPPD